MSYELYFYRSIEDKQAKKGILSFLKGKDDHHNGQVNDEELLHFLMSFKNFPEPKQTTDGFDAGYLNIGTKMSIGTATHFIFHFHRDTIEDHEKYMSFPGFRYTGLKVFMNLVRPLYFGHEAAPIIEAVCNKFSFYIVDPQDHLIGGTGKPKLCLAVDLIRSWEATNSSIGRSMIARAKEKGNIKYIVGPDLSLSLAKEKSLTWWKYTRVKQEIKEFVKKNDKYWYVPDIRLLKKKDGHTVLLVMVFVEDVGYLIPPCDIFYIMRNQDKETGYVDANFLLAEIDKYLEPWHYAGIDFKVLSVENAPKIAEVIRNIKIDAPDNYVKITPGSFIDFE